ncbi:MAG: hypothetical protein JWM91_4017 [Rhodospirillales bacterium]|nr:hypothetical protein [Rhodospirillales bacterium]
MIVTVPITVLVVLFAVSNLDEVTLRLRPFPFEMTMPIWALTLIELFVGFILGAIVTWIGDRKRRRDARLAVRRAGELEQALSTARRQIVDLEKKLGELRGQTPLPAV